MDKMRKAISSFYLKAPVITTLLRLALLFFTCIFMINMSTIPFVICLILLYIFTIRPVMKLKKTIDNLPQYDKERFIEDLHYDADMKIWCSGKYLIGRNLLITDISKAIWMYVHKEIHSMNLIPYYKVDEIRIHMQDDSRWRGWGWLVSLPRKGQNFEFIAGYAIGYNPKLLVGYHNEAIHAYAKMKREYKENKGNGR